MVCYRLFRNLMMLIASIFLVQFGEASDYGYGDQPPSFSNSNNNWDSNYSWDSNNGANNWNNNTSYTPSNSGGGGYGYLPSPTPAYSGGGYTPPPTPTPATNSCAQCKNQCAVDGITDPNTCNTLCQQKCIVQQDSSAVSACTQCKQSCQSCFPSDATCAAKMCTTPCASAGQAMCQMCQAKCQQQFGQGNAGCAKVCASDCNTGQCPDGWISLGANKCQATTGTVIDFSNYTTQQKIAWAITYSTTPDGIQLGGVTWKSLGLVSPCPVGWSRQASTGWCVAPSGSKCGNWLFQQIPTNNWNDFNHIKTFVSQCSNTSFPGIN